MNCCSATLTTRGPCCLQPRCERLNATAPATHDDGGRRASSFGSMRSPEAACLWGGCCWLIASIAAATRVPHYGSKPHILMVSLRAVPPPLCITPPHSASLPPPLCAAVAYIYSAVYVAQTPQTAAARC